MVIRSRENFLGAWAFLIGVVLAVVIGLSASSLLPWQKVISLGSPIYAILVIMGLLVGFSIRVSGKDAQTFLLAGAVLVVVSKFGMESVTGSFIGIGVGKIVGATFAALLALFVPATIIVSLKTVFSLAKI